MESLILAHLSDLHLPSPERAPRLRDLMGKRLFSWLSWRAKRRFLHRPEVLARVMTDIAGQGTGHLVVSGDLVNLSLPEEFEHAQAWLAAAGSPDDLTVVPGNHDALVSVPPAQGLERWRAWMGGEGASFPFVKQLGAVALIGVSTAIPTAPFLATGRVGAGQLERLERLLGELGRDGLFRIVVLHHPPADGAVSDRKALSDRAALRAVLARAGAELVLHGHSHEQGVSGVPGPEGPILVLAAPSASADPAHPGPPAGWNRIAIEPANDAWRVRVELRRLGAGGESATTQLVDRNIPRLRRT